MLQVPFTQIHTDEDVSEAEHQVQVLYLLFDLYSLLGGPCCILFVEIMHTTLSVARCDELPWHI